MIKLIKTHYVAIILAVFFGIATVVPQLFAINELGSQWTGNRVHRHY